jgi:hypothetical protein
VNVHH